MRRECGPERGQRAGGTVLGWRAAPRREDWSWEGAREGRSAQGGISGQGSHVKSKRSRVLNADMCRVLCEALSVWSGEFSGH